MAKLPHILVVPFPAQGHVMPLMEFSHQLVDHGIKVTFVTTESIHNMLLSTLVDHKEGKSRIHQVSIPDVLNLHDSHKGSKNLIEVMLEPMPGHLEELIKKMNESDDEKIDCLVADATVGRVLEVADKFGIRRAAFWPAPLGVLAFMLHVPKLVQAGDINDDGNPMKEEAIRLPLSMPAMTAIDLFWGSSGDSPMRKMMLTFILDVNKACKAANWILCNSFYELEPASHNFIPNIQTIGPLLASERLRRPTGHLLPEDTTCLAWLDQQPAQSVIYIAFGSVTIFNHSQFNELVQGLKLLDRPFLWVVRPGLTDDLGTSWLDSFRARHGKTVEWAPQQKVLAHPSIACFVTHCGWNSTIEGVSMGVPLLCWPYVADQFHNQNYICDIWKVGFKFNQDENGIVTRSEIKTKVEDLLGDEGIRSRINKLKDMAKMNVSEGGLSSKNLEDFIKNIKS